MIKKTFLFFLIVSFYFGLSPHATSHGKPSNTFIILNLRWEQNTIRLNALHVAQGVLKKKRAAYGKNAFFYRIFSRDDAVIDQGYFEVPRRIHFDYLNENGELSGGSFLRRAVDFAIRIPAHENSHKILFYRLKNITDPMFRIKTASMKEKLGELIGEITLR